MTRAKPLPSRNGRSAQDELPWLFAMALVAEWGLKLLGVLLIVFGAWLFLDELRQLWRQW